MQSIDNLKDHMDDTLSFMDKSKSQEPETYSHKKLKRQLTKEDQDEANGAVQMKRRATIKEKKL